MSETGNTYSYSFEEEQTANFNPLEDFSFADEADEFADEEPFAESPFGMPDPTSRTQIQGGSVSFANADTPSERIDALFAQMPTLQKMLYDILDMCQSPLASDELETRVTELKEHHHCVYAPLTFCNLLEQAGALSETDSQGTPLKDITQEPTKIEVNDVEYWTVTPAPPVFWQTTEEGREQLDAYRPLELIRSCYEAEPQYSDIFTTVLELTAREGGSSMKQIGNVIDDEPAVQNPRRFAMYFIDKLERAGGVEWKGSWVITSPGAEHLESLARSQAEQTRA